MTDDTPVAGPGQPIYAKKNHTHPGSGVALEGTTAPPATAGASVLGAATTASHADHTHQTGTHTHTEADTTNLTSDLAGKAASVHTHAEADTTNLVSDLAGKAASVHTHAESDVTALVADLAALPKGRIASAGTQNTTTGSITTVELVYAAIANLAVTTVNGRRYKVSFTLYASSTVANDTVFLRLRDGLGSAPTNASALLYEANWCCGPANIQQPVQIAFEWLPGATTAHHLGLFALRNAGTGTITVGSASAGRLSDLIIEDVGT